MTTTGTATGIGISATRTTVETGTTTARRRPRIIHPAVSPKTISDAASASNFVYRRGAVMPRPDSKMIGGKDQVAGRGAEENGLRYFPFFAPLLGSQVLTCGAGPRRFLCLLLGSLRLLARLTLRKV